MQELISVIVPVYNAEKYLSRCIDSILKQTYYNIELILINDGSTDQSVKIVDDYAKIDNRIVVVHQNNRGVSEARNVGLKLAKGKYIGFVDADDTVAPTMYQKLWEAVQQVGADIAIANWYNVVSEKNKMPADSSQLEKYLSMTMEELLRKVYCERQVWLLCSVCNKLIRAELAKKVCFETMISNGEDIWYSYQVLSAASKVVSISEPLYNYYFHLGSASRGGVRGERRITGVEVHKKIVLDLNAQGYSSLAQHAYAYYLDFILYQINSKKDDLVYQSTLKRIFKKQAMGIIKCKVISMKLKICYLLYVIKL